MTGLLASIFPTVGVPHWRAVVGHGIHGQDTQNLVLPTGINKGDLIILAAANVNSQAGSAPSGYTALSGASGSISNTRLQVYYKISDGTDSLSSPSPGMGTTNFRSAAIVLKRDWAAGVSFSTPTAQATSGNPSAQNIAASGATRPCVAVGIYWCFGAIDPRTMSPNKDGEVTAATNLYIAWRIMNTTFADVSIDMDDESSDNILVGFYVQHTEG
jgi:hypothetical protein